MEKIIGPLFRWAVKILPERPNNQLPENELEEGLLKLCKPPRRDDRHPATLAQETFQQISNLLRNLDKLHGRNDTHDSAWRFRPRTYTILRNINTTNLMNLFIENEFTDLHLPYTEQTLPNFVKGDELRAKFLSHQTYVLSNARLFENGSRSHINVNGSAERYFGLSQDLGHGGFGIVDQVWSKLGLKQYARKRLRRRNDNDANRRRLSTIVKEIELLKLESHRHLVRIVSSYSDTDYIAFLMEPVADCDLAAYLKQYSEDKSFARVQKQSLKFFYGCLSGAIRYLHTRKIHHRDISSRNILVKDKRIFIADLGSASCWRESEPRTTNNRTPINEFYMAPEVAQQKPRNPASDLWSIGVVFLEMTTVLLGKSTTDLMDHLDRRALERKNSSFVWANLPAAFEWMRDLPGTAPSIDNEPLAWVQILLQLRPENRPTAESLMQKIQDSPAFDMYCCHECIPDFKKSTADLEREALARLEPARDDGREDLFTQVSQLLKDKEASEIYGPGHDEMVNQWRIRIWDDVQEMPGSFEIRPMSEIAPSSGSVDQTRNNSALLTESPKEGDLEPLISEHLSKMRRSHDTGYGWRIMSDSDDSSDDNDDSSHSKFEFDHTQPFQVIDDGSDSELEFVTDNTRDVDDEASPFGGAEGMVNYEAARSKIAIRESEELITTLETIDDEDETSPTSPPPFSNYLRSESFREDLPRHTASSNSGLNGPKCADTLEVAQQKHKVVDHMKEEDQCSHSVIKHNNDTHDQSSEEDVRPQSSNTSISSMERIEGIDGGPKDEHKTCTAQQSAGHISVPEIKVDSSFVILHGPPSPSTIPYMIPVASQISIPGEPADLPSPKELSLKDDISIPAVSGTGMKAPQRSSFEFLNVPTQSTWTGHRRRNELSALNLRLLEPEAESKSLKSQHRICRRFEPDISPSAYMQNAWEAASSVGTSALSEVTKRTLPFFPTRILDRDYRFLEKYCADGKAAAVRLLLERKCNPGTKEKPRLGPLRNAISGASLRHNKCVSVLLDFNADVNQRHKKDGTTPIHWAIETPNFKGHNNLIRLLIDAGADPNQPDLGGTYPLQKIFAGGASEPLEKYRLDMLACLLKSNIDSGINVNIPLPGTLNTPLHLAVSRRDVIATGMLLQKGATVNEKNSSGTTPLLLAANQWRGDLTSSQEQILEQLLERDGLLIDEKGGSMERTALHQAVAAGACGAAEMLIDAGANPTLLDRDGMDALAIALKVSISSDGKVHGFLIRLLSSAFKKQWPFNRRQCLIGHALSSPDEELMEDLLQSGMEANLSYQGKPLLFHAISAGRLSLVELLVSNGSSLTDTNGDDGDATAYAAQENKDEIRRYLLKERWRRSLGHPEEVRSIPGAFVF